MVSLVELVGRVYVCLSGQRSREMNFDRLVVVLMRNNLLRIIYVISEENKHCYPLTHVTYRGLALLVRSGCLRESRIIISLSVGSSGVLVDALRLSGLSALCETRFPMVDRELCRTMG